MLDGELGLDPNSPGRQRRADFAEWISSADNPLTARVMVNRLWHHVFGSGIVPTTSDFGTAGAPPTHPELLDWLACRFRDDGWNVRDMVRDIVTSSTYRQASEGPGERNAELYAGYPRQRLSAEQIRDQALHGGEPVLHA